MNSCIPYTPPSTQVLPAMAADSVALVREYEREALKHEQVDIHTMHTLHAGMYARTIMLPEGTVLSGVLIRRATLLILSGHVTVFVGGGTVELEGYHVLAGSAGRKQIFRAHRDTHMTLVFPTEALTVEQAEADMTDEAHLLFSRNGNESIHITEDEI